MSRGLFPYSIYLYGGGKNIMAEQNNTTCSICGNPYYLCMSCRDSLQTNPWKVHTDTSEHYKIYQIIRGFNTNVYTKDEARIKLKNVNLDDLNSFRPHIKKIIKDIIKEDKITAKIVKNVEDNKIESSIEQKIAVEENVIEDMVVEDIANTENIVKQTVSRKRNYMADADIN